MGVFSFEDENPSPVPPTTLYNALAIDPDTIIPKAIDSFKSVENIEGTGGPGTIKKINFVEDGEDKFVLHKIEAIDEANLGYTYSIVGGAPLAEGVLKITFDTKIVAGSDGGSIVKISGKVETKEGVAPNEEEIKVGKAKSGAIFKALEAYLLANP